TAARLTVTSANLTLLVTSPANVDLTAPVSGDILDLAVNMSAVTDDVTTARGGASIGTSGNVTATNNAATIWVGGTLTPKTDQASDGYDQETYTGTVPVTVTYD
ncbi:MAG: DUF4402 domain-containing protein, partial [Balneolaceae bacterium]|nr:DUF4402 domain-containing protein [Balneolaceae bacterium]